MNKSFILFFFICFTDFNLWSENNWSPLSKELNAITKFPLPGQVGVVDVKKINLFNTNKQRELKEEEEEEYSKQFDLFYRPLANEHCMQTLMQIGNSINNEASKSGEDNTTNKKLLELNAYKCPISLAKGKL